MGVDALVVSARQGLEYVDGVLEYDEAPGRLLVLVALHLVIGYRKA